MKPPRSVFDPKFKYTSAAATDVRKTFRRARLLQRIRNPSNVMQLPTKKTA